MYIKYLLGNFRIQRQIFASAAATAGRYNPGQYEAGRYNPGQYDAGRYKAGNSDNSGRYVPDNAGAYK